ncbi:MAG: VTT domain-containing protein [Nanoarchaeota archaeon]|nr:VTT domain-containing protein [Nanoarchaeota archaeon]
MKQYYSIQENNPLSKIKALVYSIIALILFLFLAVFFYKFWYNLIQSTPILQKIIIYLSYNFVNTTPIGLFYEHFIGGIFLVPSADELVFYYALLNGNPVIFSLVAALIGYMLAQIVNYIIGSQMSSFMLHLVSKKKVYKTKRWVNKYGVYGIFFFNFIPILPAPLLIFALGVTKYNFKRLFIITLIAKVFEYLALIGLFLLFSA